MIDPQFQNLTSEQKLSAIRHYEKEVEQLFAAGKITEWDLWECYFELMYNCNLAGFNEDRERIADKIDKEKFNPFLSKRMEIIIIARDIAARHKIQTKLDN